MTPITSEMADAPSGHGPAGELLRVTNVAKRFGSTQALRRCSFDLRAGEVHTILGENGSGKSTMVKVLAGVHRPDAGDITLYGQPVHRIRSPRMALESGIVTVFQEVLAAAHMTVLDNVWLGQGSLVRHELSRRVKRGRAARALAALLGETLSLDAPVAALPLSARQACCIARALVRDPKVLVLDEATSALDIETRDNLFRTIRELTAAGAGVVFISHRMDEIEQISDRITVLRSGESVATRHRGVASVHQLIELMTGKEGLVHPAARKYQRARADGEVVLAARGVTLAPGARPIDFEARAGEITGLAGLEGHGQDRFLRVLGGVAAPHAGEIVTHSPSRADRTGPVRSPRDAAARGIAYVPRDRRSESIFESRSVLDNFALPTQGLDTRVGFLSASRSARRFRPYTERLKVVSGGDRQLITKLSGGNQQKVITARWLAANPRVLLLNDPTRGVDLGAKRDIYQTLHDIAASGVSVIMLSSEIDEHLELMDRILVFRENSVAAELARAEATRQRLLASFFGPGARG